MARRDSYPGNKWYKRPGQAYARTSGWPTRYYQRKISGSMVSALSGINTTADDFEKKEGESPYLWNARLNGTKEKRKRAQSMSRMGQSLFAIPNGAETEHVLPAGDTRIPVAETMSVKWEINTTNTLTSVGLRFEFDEVPTSSSAHFVLILRDAQEHEICRAIRKIYSDDPNVHALYQHAGELEWFRFIKTTKGKAYLEASVVDDFNKEGKPMQNIMFINAQGTAGHSYSRHDLPNLDEALREKAYTWYRGINIPTTSYRESAWKTFPVWLQRGFFNADTSRWSVMGAIDGNGNKNVYAVKYADYDPATGDIQECEAEVKKLISYSHINSDAEQVRMAQAGDSLYFVDGFSALQRITLTGTEHPTDPDQEYWEVSNAAPSLGDVDTFGYAGGMYYYTNSIIIADNGDGTGSHFWRCIEDHQGCDSFTSSDGNKHEYEYWTKVDSGESLTAWPGASLIYFHNNRLLLSGFRYATVGEGTPKAEPNLVIMSSITSVRPQYEMFNRSIEFFYVPDHAQSQTAASPVTAFAHIGDYLLVFTTDGLVLEQIESAVEFAGISQTTPEGSQYGVMKQEHVAEGRNNVYFYNTAMGIMRTAGSTANVISGPIDSVLSAIPDESRVTAHLCMTNDLLKFYYNPDGTDNTECLIDYVSIPQHRSYWFRDNNTPVTSTCIDIPSDICMAIHSQFPCMMKMDDGFKDFDCAILYEYYTKYIGTPDRLDHVIVRRIHLTTLQTFQSSVYIGLDYNHNNKPIVWRRFITPIEKGTYAPEDIFGDDEESGATNIDIRILTEDTRFVQIRLKQYCYDFQAEIMQVGFEYANRTTL